MKNFLTRQTPLLGLCLALPMASSCALAQQDGQKPARGKGQGAGQRGKRGKAQNQNRPNGNAAKPNDEANADIEVKDNPDAGQDFIIQAPMSVPIPATHVAPPKKISA